MDNKQRSVKLNMFMNAILTMSSFIFPLITFPYVSRVLLAEGTGKINFAMSVVAYFSMFAQLGIPTYGVRACAKVRDDKEKLSKLVHELLFINLFMSVLAYIVFLVSIVTVPRFEQEKLLFLVVGANIILNAIGVEWLYKALEQYTYITVRSVLFKLISVIAMFLLVHNQQDYVIYGGITIFATSASNVLNFINMRKYISIKPIDGYQIKPHIKMIIVFFFMSVATTIYTNLDNVMLGFMKGDAEVGYYGAAVKIKMILVSFVTSVSAVLLPRASYYVDKGLIDEFYRVLKKTMHFVVMIAIPLTVYFIMYAEEGIYFLSGKEYENSIIPMQIIMPTLILIGITNVTGIQMMVPLGREKQVLHSEIAGAIVDLILNMIFIPRYGAAGAAFGTLIAEIVVLMWQCVGIKDIKAGVFMETPWIKIVCGTICGALCAVWVKYLELGYFLALAVSAICFFVIYGVVLMIMKEQLIKDLTNQFANKIKEKMKK